MICQLLAGTAILLAAAPREEITLNGTWQYQVVDQLGQRPADGPWLACSVPGYLRGVDYKRAWFRRAFELPDSMRGKRIKIHFGGVKYNSRVYVNGKQVGGCFGGHRPFEVDVTEAVRPGGPNELLVACHDWTGVFTPGRLDPDDRLRSRTSLGRSPRKARAGLNAAPCGGILGEFLGEGLARVLTNRFVPTKIGLYALGNPCGADETSPRAKLHYWVSTHPRRTLLMFGNRFLKLCMVGLLLAWPAAAVDADAINIDWVTVGDPGNTADTDGDGYGAVGYSYNIGKYEVTAGQYRDFLNAVDPTGANSKHLYNSSMDTESMGCQITRHEGSTYDFSGRPSGTEADWENRPVNYVSFYDTLRFCNWLHNGQGSGDTEDGAYLMSLNAGVVWKSGALFFLPSEDEWYKAAYYDGAYDGATAEYFNYPTSSNTEPGYVKDDLKLSNDTAITFTDGVTDPGKYATYDGDGGTDGIGAPYYRTEVGEWENSASPYGTFDQGGNVWEWNEALAGSSRGLRGGSFVNTAIWLRASSRDSSDPAAENYLIGFRVASISIPEPSSIILLVSGLLAGLIWRRRRK